MAHRISRDKCSSALPLVIAALIAGGIDHPASAQQTTPSAPTDGGEIVVTALKRDTVLQDTPISISAITGASLANAGVQNIADLSASVPGLTFVDSGPSQRRVVIRGIQGAGEPLVGTYYDEAPVTGSVGATNDAGGSTPELRLFDVERVEVLRGPQGTLYGSGSMGGTLRIIYNKPRSATEAAVDTNLSGTQGGGLNYNGSAMVNLPVVQDKIAVRAIGFYQHDAGYIDNIVLGIKNINRLKSYGGRFLARITPVDDLTIDAAAYINRSNTDTPAWTAESGPYNSDNYSRQPVRDKVELYTLTTKYDFGGVTLTGVGSYLHRDFFSATLDAYRFFQSAKTPARCAGVVNGGAACSSAQLTGFYSYLDGISRSLNFPHQIMSTWTGEVRLASDGHGPFNWTVGGFYSRRQTNVDNPLVNADASGTVIQPYQIGAERKIDDNLKQLAAFAEISWDVTPRLNLTAGTRYYDYTKRIIGSIPVGNALVGTRTTPATTVSTGEHGWVSKFNGSYKITRNVLLYAEAAKGFRPGGANQVIGLPGTLTPYQSDSLWNYEVGLKNTLFDRKMTFNVDVFQIDWSNTQITGRTPDGAFAFITNAGKARVRGIEAETSIRPVRGVNLGGNISYIDAVLTENQSNANVSAAGLKGDRIPYVPKFTAAASAEYRVPVTGELNAMFRGDFNHSGGYLSDFRPNGTFTRRINGYDLVNLRAGLENDRFGAYLFVTNVFDKVAITRAFSAGTYVGRTLVNSATPRTIGINLRAKFG